MPWALKKLRHKLLPIPGVEGGFKIPGKLTSHKVPETVEGVAERS